MTEQTRFWPRVVFHVDMDAFFAAIEVLDDPGLAGRPVVVGGPAEGRGVVAAASYEARTYGVRSAMPMAQALRLCPDLVVVPPRGDRYREMSRAVRAVFDEFTPLVEPVSVDEAFLDVTGSQRLFGPPETMARKLKDRIRSVTGLTASVGGAPVKFVAKIASDLDKPDGLVLIPEEEMLDRLAVLPVERLWGVGRRMTAALRDMGVRTVADLRAWPEKNLRERFGVHGAHLSALARGCDERTVEPEADAAKSVSHETTFSRDILDADELCGVVLDLADRVARRMRRSAVAGRVVFIKVRYADFSTVTRRTTLPEPSSLAATMAATAREMLLTRTEAGVRPVRLVGVGMSDLVDEAAAAQRSLFGDGLPDRTEALERAADAIRDRLGDDAIRRAASLDRPDTRARHVPFGRADEGNSSADE